MSKNKSPWVPFKAFIWCQISFYISYNKDHNMACVNNCLHTYIGHVADKYYYLKSFRLKCPISAFPICKRVVFYIEARIPR